MTERSDINAGKIAMIGALGVIVSAAVALAGIVSYFAVADRVAQSRSDEAAMRTKRQVEQIVAGKPVSQPWLNADLQRATQEVQLARYARRTMKQEDGSQRTTYAVPIQHAMESILHEAADAVSGVAQPKEAGT